MPSNTCRSRTPSIRLRYEYAVPLLEDFDDEVAVRPPALAFPFALPEELPFVPRDERSGSATDAGVPEFMDTLMMDATDGPRAREDRQTAMRGGLAWLDVQCRRRFGHDFTACADGERTALLDDIAYLEPGEDPHPFFAGFRDLTASGFWSSRMGIEDVGYQGNTFVREWKGVPPEVKARLGVADEG